MSRYQVFGRVVDDATPAFEAALSSAYGRLPRPLCLCRVPGVEMYIAKVGRQFIIKRMPDSGYKHAPSCPSFDPPASLSGFGDLAGGAIHTDALSGITTLKVDFPLSRGASGKTEAKLGGSKKTEQLEAQSAGSRLGLHGLLHYLWSEAGFHRWSPAMAGKRNWFVLRKYLMLAAGDKVVRGQTLASMLFIPESFDLEHKKAIALRREALFAHFSGGEGARPLMLVLAEVKELRAARFGSKLLCKHLPDVPFHLREDIAAQVSKRFAAMMGMWNTMEDLHLMVFGTCSVNGVGVPSMEAMTLTLVNEQWLPVETPYDKTLVDTLVRARRRFDKGLRYQLASDVPVAAAVLTDCPDPVAMYVVTPQADEAYRSAISTLGRDSDFARWIWSCLDGEMPPLPPPMGHGHVSAPDA